jgi:hypothetical protein
MKKCIALAVLMIMLAISACGGNRSIVGIWEVTVNAETKTLELNDDGGYTVTNGDGSVEEYGIYKTDGNVLIFTSAYKLDGGTHLNLQEDSEDMMTFSISGKILTLTIKNGDSMELARKQ